MNKTIYKGVWFLPHKPKAEISGELTITEDEGYFLDLLGHFPGPHDLNKKIEIILGYTSNGEEITLIDNYIKQFRLGVPGFPTCEFLCNKIVIGGHFKQYSEIKLRNVDVRIKSLSNWLGVYGFKPISIDKNRLATFQINYDIPDKIDFEIDEKFSGQFNFFVTTGIGHLVPEMRITQTTAIRFQANELASVDEYLELIFAFQSFLALAFFKYPIIESIESEDNSSDDTERNTRKLKFLFNTKFNNDKDIADFLFRYSDISEKINEILKKWFGLFKNIRPVVGGLIYSFEKNNGAPEFSFLNVVQSLETLHRRIRSNCLLDKEEFKIKMTEITNGIPDKYKKWVIEKLQYSNEPTLLDRLKEILHELPFILKEKLFDDEKVFLRRIKDTRNYYVHYSKHLEKNALKDAALFYATEKLKVILVAFLLKELSILNEEFTSEFVKRGHRLFYYTFQNFKSVIP